MCFGQQQGYLLWEYNIRFIPPFLTGRSFSGGSALRNSDFTFKKPFFSFVLKFPKICFRVKVTLRGANTFYVLNSKYSLTGRVFSRITRFLTQTTEISDQLPKIVFFLNILVLSMKILNPIRGKCQLREDLPSHESKILETL